MQTDNEPKYTQSYSNISAIYENALASHHKHAQVVLERLSTTYLHSGSRILDVGCGTGKPITSYFADKGHDVTGIDYSSGMLELARTAIPNATFLQADMTSWEFSDERQYDMVVASHCFYNFSVAQLRSLIYKLSYWAKKDGLVVIGMSYNQGTLNRRGMQFDQRGWAEGFTNTFLGHDYDSTFGRQEAWADLIKSTGLEIIHIDNAVCLKANDPNPDVQFYFTTKKVQTNPLIGPFPLPNTFSGPVTIQPEPWGELSEKREMTKVNKAAFEALREDPSCFPKIPNIEFQQTTELPSPDVQPGTFDGVLLNWILHLVPFPGDYIDHALKTISPSGNARIIVIQAAPDNELVNLINEASQGLNLPIQHHGSLLHQAEDKCKAAGFQAIRFIRSQGSINFGSIRGDERVEMAASLLSRLYTADESLQGQLEERLQNLLKVHFLFKLSGEITSQTVILVAEKK
ncbi:hypothetical protein Clacol_008119 [Clathrus columnatus]|uniref:Methyltransferase domain-containing protein n=1 Tax=Clathrus columnatus TaxID=1419009 RepID=A0AAV5AGU2_9AGAM|nr:hypothetical protein Clacol_008119 [Clathrus columnatus]